MAAALLVLVPMLVTLATLVLLASASSLPASSAVSHPLRDGSLTPALVDTAALDAHVEQAALGNFEHHPDDANHDRHRPMHVERYEQLIKDVRDAVPDDVHKHLNEPHRKGMGADATQSHARKLQAASASESSAPPATRVHGGAPRPELGSFNSEIIEASSKCLLKL